MIDERPTHVDLFSGICGFALAAQWAGFRTVAFCEIDAYCQKVLAKNFLADAEHSGQQGSWQHEIQNGREADAVTSRCKIWSNIFDFDGTAYRDCDLLTGGFPCQPFSVSGKRRGAADDRALWPEIFRVINEARPAWILAENVPGIIPMELDNVLSDLESIGYACRPLVIPACAVDARHRRDRVWIVAHSNSAGFGERRLQRNSAKWERLRTNVGQRINNARCEWLPEPDVGRVAHGIPSRVDRLKGLGNAIVPQVAYEILREIRNLIYENNNDSSSNNGVAYGHDGSQFI